MTNSFSSILFYEFTSLFKNLNLSLLQIILLCSLGFITLFRRRLSSNYEYKHIHRSHPLFSIYKNRRALHKERPIKAIIMSIIEQFFQPIKKQGDLFQNFKPEFLKKDIIDEEFLRVMKPGNINNLSSDILYNIASYLETIDICRWSMTSIHFQKELTSDVLWELLWQMTYSQIWRVPTIKAIREDRHIYWDPELKYSSPQSGWYKFYLAFEACWIDWILAGYCSKRACLVSIDNGIFDVTKFQKEHPGSFETLNEAGGSDSTDLFLEAGHSGRALKLLGKFCIWDPFHIFLPKFQSISSNTSSFNNLLEGNNAVDEENEDDNEVNLDENEQEVEEETEIEVEPPIDPPFLCLGCYSIPKGTRIPPTCSPLLSHYKSAQSRVVEIANEYLKPKTDEQKGLDSFLAQIKVLGSFSSIGEAKSEHNNSFSDLSNYFSPSISPTKTDSLIDSVMNLPGTIRRYSMSMKDAFSDDENIVPYTETDALFDSLEQVIEPFGPQKVLVPNLTGYFHCKATKYSVFVEHVGQAKAYFDPLSREWIVWWTCCGKSQSLEEVKLIKHNSEGKPKLINFLEFVFGPGI